MNAKKLKWHTSFLGVLILLLAFTQSKAQNDRNWEIGGYVKYLQTVTSLSPDSSELYIDNLVHNRLNFNWYPGKNWKVHAGMRNRLFYGDFVKILPGYADLIAEDMGYFDLTFNWFEGEAYFLNTTFDRLYVDYTTGKWQVKVGRQRVNWGQNLVWNPNDVFNAFSYFDFDYEERPGTDAVRIQYYPSFTSKAEFVYQLGETLEESSFMGLYRFNKWEYDIQLLGGYALDDIVAGLGWSGHIGGAGFRGEATYFSIPANEEGESRDEQVVASISGDYTFKNSLYLHASAIYNSKGDTENIQFNYLGQQLSLSAKTLTPSRMELFYQMAYQISPLFYGSASMIYNPFDASFFMAPSLSVSMMDNLELYLIAQIFSGGDRSQYGGFSNLYFWRMRWSF